MRKASMCGVWWLHRFAHVSQLNMYIFMPHLLGNPSRTPHIIEEREGRHA